MNRVFCGPGENGLGWIVFSFFARASGSECLDVVLWGMNFIKMPELQFAYGYPIALTMMLSTGTDIFFYFKKTGWLD